VKTDNIKSIIIKITTKTIIKVILLVKNKNSFWCCCGRRFTMVVDVNTIKEKGSAQTSQKHNQKHMKSEKMEFNL